MRRLPNSLTAAVFALVAVGCKSNADNKQERPTSSTAPRSGVPVARTDANVRVDPRLAKPLQFAARVAGKPVGIPTCPTRNACVVEVDYAYVVMADTWTHHYILDHGAPNVGLRKGLPQRGSISQRLNAAVRAVVRDNGGHEVSVHCAIAYDLRTLLTLQTYVVASVPAPTRPSAAASALTPPQANRRAAAVLGNSSASAPLFNQSDRARMTANTFADPRISSAHSETGTPKQATHAHVAVVWSPKSRRVYLVAQTDNGSVSELRAAAAVTKRRKTSETSVIALLQGIGVKTVKLDSRRLCEFERLSGYGRWLSAKF